MSQKSVVSKGTKRIGKVLADLDVDSIPVSDMDKENEDHHEDGDEPKASSNKFTMVKAKRYKRHPS